MRTFERKTRLLAPLWIAVLWAGVIPGRALADEKGKSDPPAKATTPNDGAAKPAVPNDEAARPAPIKMDAPAPGLTERERWLLDRVELLEKRVAELESKGNAAGAPAAAPAVEAVAAPPTSQNAAALPAALTLRARLRRGFRMGWPTPLLQG